MSTNTEALPPLPEKWCLFCDKAGHQSHECWSTYGDNTPRSNELLRLAALAQRQQVPHPGSPEASAMMDSVLAEYGWPANAKNAARAGFEAARRLLAAAPAITAAPSAQAELRMSECPGCGMEFADGALHNANLELHRLKNAAQKGPAIRLALDSSLVAARKALEGRSGVGFLDGWGEFVEAITAAQAEPCQRQGCATTSESAEPKAKAEHTAEDRADNPERARRSASLGGAALAQAEPVVWFDNDGKVHSRVSAEQVEVLLLDGLRAVRERL